MLTTANGIKPRGLIFFLPLHRTYVLIRSIIKKQRKTKLGIDKVAYNMV